MACNGKHAPETASEQSRDTLASPTHYQGFTYLNDGRSAMLLDTTLSCKTGFAYDSAIAIDYMGREDGYTDVLDEEGRWISTVHQRKPLTKSHCDRYKKILGSPLTYQNGSQSACFEPHMAIVYYKAGIVVTQTAICLRCQRISSSAILGDGRRYSSINDTAASHLVELCKEIGFPPYGKD